MFFLTVTVLRNTIKGNAKGGIYENLISEMRIKKGYLFSSGTINGDIDMSRRGLSGS